MKTKKFKLFSLFVAVIMVCLLASTAFASDAPQVQPRGSCCPYCNSMGVHEMPEITEEVEESKKCPECIWWHSRLATYIRKPYKCFDCGATWSIDTKIAGPYYCPNHSFYD